MLTRWTELRSPSDTSKMAEQMEGGYAELFNKAFRQGKCNDKVFKIMASFYSAKAKHLKKFL